MSLRATFRFPLLQLSFLGFLVGFPCATPSSVAQTETEARVRGVMVLRLAQFTQWPTPTDSDEEIVIGATEGDERGIELSEETVRVSGQRFKIRDQLSLEELESCDVLVVRPCEVPELREFLGRVEGRPVLTISEMDGFVENGGMVQFVRRDETVRFVVSLDALRKAGIGMNSKVLRLAELHGEEAK